MPVITITIQVNAPAYAITGIKEVLAMELERFGDTKVISVKDDTPPMEQMRIGGYR